MSCFGIFGVSLLFCLCIIFTAWDPCHGRCDIEHGPPNIIECLHITHYDKKYQWGTCLSNAYIKQKSGGRHRCRNKNATYCYYQCMLEVHKLAEGPVYPDCSCNKGDTLPLADPSIPAFPNMCFNPDGTGCSWYRQCLKKKYPCVGSQNGYAFTYVEKFCLLYTSVSSGFSFRAQSWINAMRKCLQVSLVPLFRPWDNSTCTDIKRRAFDSHTQCYTKPYKEAPSVCGLLVGEWWKVFWTIKNTFNRAPVPTLKEILETWLECGSSYMQRTYDYVRIIRLKVPRRTEIYVDDDDLYAGEIADSIADNLDWKSNGVGWFAYTTNDSLSEGQKLMNISIIIADKFKLDVYVKETSTLNLNQTVKTLADAVRTRTLNIQVRGESDPVSIKTMFACEDVECKQVLMNVIGAVVDVTSTAVDATSTAVDVTSTAVDVTSTAVDVTSTAVDVTSTAVDVTSTAVDVTSTAVDVTSTAVDVTSIAVDVTSKAVDVTSTAVDVTSTAVDVSSTAVDVTSTAVDVTSTAVDVTSTAVDVTSTAVDVTSTAVDVTSTAVDVTSTTVDVTRTAVDVISTAVDITSTAVDVTSTAVDVTSTAVDVISTAVDVSSAGVYVTSAAMDVTDAAVDVTDAAVDVTDAAVDVTDAAVGVTDAAVDVTDAAMDVTDAAVGVTSTAADVTRTVVDVTDAAVDVASVAVDVTVAAVNVTGAAVATRYSTSVVVTSIMYLVYVWL